MTTSSTNRTVYVIAGPTAVGKSAVAFQLAKRIGGEIVNCDSVQLYKYMDIGSAKPTVREMKEVPHHLFNLVEPSYHMSAAKYQKLAFTVIDNILARGKTPILVGGTGLYLNSVLYKMDFARKPVNMERRRALEHLAEKRGNQYLYELLTAVDPDAASRIHPNNTRKVIRAIEAYELGSQIKPMDELEKNTDYDFRVYGLTMNRPWLYDRINRRVIRLFKDGLLDEVKDLLARGYDETCPAMKGIGYKEVLRYFRGNLSFKDCVLEIQKNTRHYAKRQLTWLRRYGDIRWIEITKGMSVGSIVDLIMNL